MAEPTPLEDLMVGDRYWLGKAREMVSAQIKLRDEAAGRLATAIGWFWTVYSVAALVGTAISDRVLGPRAAFLLALPTVLLVVAYVFVVLAGLPVSISFDPRAPELIEQAHSRAAAKKRSRLNVAAWFTVAAAVFVSVAVVMAATSSPAVGPALRAVHIEQDGGEAILVNGTFAPHQEVVISVTPGTGAARRTPLRVMAVGAADGQLQDAIDPVPSARSYEVTADWTIGDDRWTLIQTVAPR